MFPIYFCMAITQGSGSAADDLERPCLGDYETCEMITIQVTLAVREIILEVLGSVNTTLIEMFDERYVATTEDVATPANIAITNARLLGGGSIKYWKFSNMKPP